MKIIQLLRPSVLSPWLKRGLDVVLPPLCHHCSKVLDGLSGLCPECWAETLWIDEPVCERLGVPMHGAATRGHVSASALAEPPPWRCARAAARYDGVARKLIHDLKFRDNLHLTEFLSMAMLRAGRQLLDGKQRLVSVPIHRRRLWRRRFNQSDRLAQKLSQLTGLDYAPDTLVRKSATKPQIGLSRTQRRRNVAGAFGVPDDSRHLIEGASVLLVDDVLTSGATAGSATRALLRAGALEVDVLCFAMVVKN